MADPAMLCLANSPLVKNLQGASCERCKFCGCTIWVRCGCLPGSATAHLLHQDVQGLQSHFGFLPRTYTAPNGEVASSKIVHQRDILLPSDRHGLYKGSPCRPQAQLGAAHSGRAQCSSCETDPPQDSALPAVNKTGQAARQQR